MPLNYRRGAARLALRLALSPLYLPFALGALALPLLATAPAAAQEYPEEYDWPSSQSRLTGVKMPPKTIRLASGMTAYPAGVVEKMVAVGKNAGMQVERREEFFWSSLTPDQLQAERAVFLKNLAAAGYSVKPMGEEEHGPERIVFFLAQKAGAKTGNGTVPGFWSIGKEFQALVLGAAPGVLGPKAAPKVFSDKQKQGFALIDAVEEKKVDEVKALLAKGIDPNSLSKNGQTPLMRAVMNDRPDIAEMLLKAGADPNRGIKDLNPLLIAAMGQQVDLIELLLDNKADINWATPEAGYTALHLAALLGKEKSAELLLKRGADTTLRTTSDGRTPAEMASRSNHPEIAEKIRAAGKE